MSRPLQQSDSLPELARSVTQDQINRYAEVSGDHNPVHLDAEFASQSTFGRIVVHGMLVLAFISEMLTKEFGKEWLDSGRLKVRFRAPVYPDDRVVTFGEVTDVADGEGGNRVNCTVGCRKVDGEDVITGEASLFIRDP